MFTFFGDVDVVFTDDTRGVGAGAFVDADPLVRGVCEACHGYPAGSGPHTLSSGMPACTVCHQHDAGFVLRFDCANKGDGNADCHIEAQTGFMTGIDGKECLINWLVSTAPPPPRMRLVGQEGIVDVLWDNFSETTPDLRLNVIDIESYRIWRADNWTRPLGTDVNTGPGSNLWMLLAEFDQPRNGIGSGTGLDDIRCKLPSGTIVSN